MALIKFNFMSKYIGANNEVSIILPDLPRGANPAEYYAEDRKFKVLWLFHGGTGDGSDWLRKSKIEVYACEHELMVVMPSCGNASFLNWKDTFGEGRSFDAFDYIAHELMPMVYSLFPASRKREDNMIAGMSPPDTGPVLFGTAFPERFGMIAMFSNFPYDLDGMKNLFPGRMNQRIAYHGGVDEWLASEENVVARLDALSSAGTLPRMYILCGTKDMLSYHDLPGVRVMAEERGWDIEFGEIEGVGHDWRFWDMAVEMAISKFCGDAERHSITHDDAHL